jgi:biopolymer transport protein ExbD
MGMKVGASGGLQNDPNVVPFIDILLVLLVIFMLMQPLSRTAFDVQVPPPQEQQQNTPQQVSDQIVLEILPDGSYAINAQPILKTELDARIHEIYDNRPAKLIFIKADENRLYEDVIEAMDIVKGAGVQVIGFTPRGAEGAQEAAGGG